MSRTQPHTFHFANKQNPKTTESYLVIRCLLDMLLQKIMHYLKMQFVWRDKKRLLDL
jgi:hypothetical protein